MNIIQTLITSTPLGNQDVTSLMVCIGLFAAGLAFISAAPLLAAHMKENARLALACCWVCAVGVFLGVMGVGIGLNDTWGEKDVVATKQTCDVTGEGVRLIGESAQEAPSGVTIAGVNLPVKGRGDGKVTIQTRAYQVSGSGWRLLRFLGLETPIEAELGIDANLQKEIAKVLPENDARALALALKSEHPTIEEFGRGFVCRGFIEKDVYGVQTRVWFKADISAKELETLAQNPVLGDALKTAIIVAQR